MKTRRRFREWVLAQSRPDLIKFAVLLAVVGAFLYYTAVSGAGSGESDKPFWQVLLAVAATVPPIAALAGGLLGSARSRPTRRPDVAVFYAAWAFALGALLAAIMWWAVVAVAFLSWANDVRV
ncbi:hypothetical protein [Krasilnikovia sp. M28-CT-15]|uniref:hypothetical protein n=1 Tax=Krasilnikovia sp. M28-CT-15 TaxID=3373540 RepID=UPI003876FA05